VDGAPVELMDDWLFEVGKLGIGLADSCLLQENTVDINQLEHIY
jgi:hypothetical protein